MWNDSYHMTHMGGSSGVTNFLPPWTSLALNPVNSNVAILFELEIFFSTNVATFDATLPLDIKSISKPPYLYLQFLKDTF